MKIWFFTLWMVSITMPLEAVVLVNALSTPVDVYWNSRGDSVAFVDYFPFDIDSNGTIDYTFIGNLSEASLRTERANRLIIQISPPPNIGGYVDSLPAGYLIGPNFINSEMGWISSDPPEGYVSPGELVSTEIIQVLFSGYTTRFTERSYIGIEFEAEDGIHYGYFDVSPSPFISPRITVNGWAWETQPGVPILAGQIPESSYVFLTSIGLMVFLTKRSRPMRQTLQGSALEGVFKRLAQSAKLV